MKYFTQLWSHWPYLAPCLVPDKQQQQQQIEFLYTVFLYDGLKSIVFPFTEQQGSVLVVFIFSMYSMCLSKIIRYNVCHHLTADDTHNYISVKNVKSHTLSDAFSDIKERIKIARDN